MKSYDLGPENSGSKTSALNRRNPLNNRKRKSHEEIDA